MSETNRPAKCTLAFKLQAVRRVKGGEVPSQPVAPTSALPRGNCSTTPVACVGLRRRGKTYLNEKLLAACAGYACFGTRRRRHADACILILVVIATPVNVEYFYTLTASAERKSGVTTTLNGVTFGSFMATTDGSGNLFVNQIPEPGTLALLGLALSGLALMRRRYSK